MDFKNLVHNLIPYIASQNENNFVISLIVLKKHLLLCLNFLKKHIGFQYSLLSCISGVDLLTKKYRFLIAYELLSLTFNSKIRIKVFLEDFTSILSITNTYINANWWEREVWDMFGIFFENHPDLRRILTDYGFEGYPLRKDFPLSGFNEMSYNSNQKAVIYVPLNLSQEYRHFNTKKYW